MGIDVDNRWVVPHNLYLATKYDCHFNIEICSSVQAVKYLYKYIYKGSDRALAKLEPVKQGTEIIIDEITDYCDARYISGIEAVWHTFHNSMHGQDPSVTLLDCHLKNQNSIIFDDKNTVSEILEKGYR